METQLLVRLLQSPVDYRQALALLDPDYREWRPQGRPRYRIDCAEDVPLLTDESAGICYVLAEISNERAARSVARFVSERPLNEVHLFEEASLCRLKGCLLAGQWRFSRNYRAQADRFRPRPHGAIRKLLPQDRGLLESARAVFPVLRESGSTRRDFDYMADGLPVVCYGAFVDARLVGFCSANPVCAGVTEIGWLAVAEEYRRRGIASGLITAQAREAFARGEVVAYYAGSAGNDLDAMLTGLGFDEAKGSYRFIPASAEDQWRTSWGLAL